AELVISVAAARDRRETMNLSDTPMRSISDTAGVSRLLPNASGYSISDWAGLAEPDNQSPSSRDVDSTGPIHDA
ncbi:MAG: glycosyltransferase, partial [Rhodopirellula bahusiensis]